MKAIDTEKLIYLVLRLNNAHVNFHHFNAMALLRPECAIYRENAVMTYETVLQDLRACIDELPEVLK